MIPQTKSDVKSSVKKPNIGYVYFIRQENKDIFKIGYTTNNPWKRKVQLQGTCPYPIDVYGYIRTPAYKSLEKHLHYVLRGEQHGLRGEWYRLKSDYVDSLIDDLSSNHLAYPYKKIKLIMDDRAYEKYYLLLCSPKEVYIDTQSLWIHDHLSKIVPWILGDRTVIPWRELLDFRTTLELDSYSDMETILKSFAPTMLPLQSIVQSLNGTGKTKVRLISHTRDDEIEKEWVNVLNKFGVTNIQLTDNEIQVILEWPKDYVVIRSFETVATQDAEEKASPKADTIYSREVC